MSDVPPTPDSTTVADFSSNDLPPSTSEDMSTDDEPAVDPGVVSPNVSQDITSAALDNLYEDEDIMSTGDNYGDNFIESHDDDHESLEQDDRDSDKLVADICASELESDANISPNLETDSTDDAEKAMDHVQGSPREWIKKDKVRRFIAKKFTDFLRNTMPQSIIDNMITDNKCSLEVDYEVFTGCFPSIARWLANTPKSVLEVMEEAATKAVLGLVPNYKNIQKKIYVRITNFPSVLSITKLRQNHLDTMVRIGGLVCRRSRPIPQLHIVKYDCTKCGNVLGPFIQGSSSEVKVGSCPQCQSKGPFTDNIVETMYRNLQMLTLQEKPGGVTAGAGYMTVILLNDLVDCAKLGEEIEVTGVYTSHFDLSLIIKSEGFPVFSTLVEANHVTKKREHLFAYKLTQVDEKDVEKLAENPRIREMIINSIAPSIHGHEDIKTAIALAVFGGQEKNTKDGLRIRGDINVLLLGDPGTAKSQFLKYVEKTALKTMYTTGKGSSAAGLTAAVLRHPGTGEWTLEAGALVLADRGICLIDEFHEMNDEDRKSILGAMEQQRISIAKAGIVQSLDAQCAVIAAANPVGGRYDSSKTFSQNVNFTDELLSHFDIICLVKDVVDPEIDEILAEAIVNTHYLSHPEGGSGEVGPSERTVDAEISQDMLKKYITYAKLNVHPTINDSDMKMLDMFYCEIRQVSAVGQGVTIVPRHLHSLIRMSQAFARMNLRKKVSSTDVNAAVQVFRRWFISIQQRGVQKSLTKKLAKFTS